MKNPIKKILKWYVDRKQQKLDNEFMKNGYSDKLLEKQAKLNKRKFKSNLKEDDYVQ